MRVVIIRSGSKGNATLLEIGKHLFLIDMGTSLKNLKAGLEVLHKDIFGIEAMFLTHEHSDHTAGIRYLKPLPIYTSKGTYDSSNVVEIKPYSPLNIEEVTILPISTSHDAKNPLGFVFKTKEESLVYVTDTGFIPDSTLPLLKNATYYIFESNHDMKMLVNSGRSKNTIERIASDFGHLSNIDSAEYLSELIGENTKEIVLVHMSLDCNTHEIALETHYRIYKKRHIDIENIFIHASSQSEMTYMGDFDDKYFSSLKGV